MLKFFRQWTNKIQEFNYATIESFKTVWIYQSSHVSFYGETSTGVAKCWLIYQPDERAKCLQYFDSLNFLINVPSFLAQQTTSNTTLARAFKFKLLACFIY